MLYNTIMKVNKITVIRGLLVSALFAVVNAVVCRLFIVPNSFASAGVEGISVLVQKASGGKFELQYVQLCFNIPLSIFAFFCVGKLFAVNTIVYSLVYSLAYWLCGVCNLDKFAYNAIYDTIYPVVLTGVITGFAYGILFREESSSGGVDIVSRFVHKKNPRFNFFYVTFFINAVIAIVSGFIFAAEAGSFDYKPVCMCVLCEFIANVIGDKIIKGGESAYKFFIIADDVSPIEKDIAQNLVHTSTRFGCYGSYSNAAKQSLLCLVTKGEIVEFEKILKRHPDCFAYVESVNKVIGYFDK